MENKTYGIYVLNKNHISKDEDYVMILMRTFVSLSNDDIHLFSQMGYFYSMAIKGIDKRFLSAANNAL